MSKTGNSPLPCPPIHPQPNTNDGRQILDQQENVSHRCFPRRASLKRPQRGLNPLPNSRPSPPFQSPSNPSLFCFFHRHVLPETQFANPSSMPVSEPRPRHRRITPQTRSYHVPDAVVSRPRFERITSQRRRQVYFPCILDNQPIGIIKQGLHGVLEKVSIWNVEPSLYKCV